VVDREHGCAGLRQRLQHVGLHVATAAALLVFFWRDWLRILAGFATSLRVRRIQTRAERLAWLIVLATIPVGLSGLALEHLFRSTLQTDPGRGLSHCERWHPARWVNGYAVAPLRP
jgi:undecaprenyl pyrophosphate phosphatase UppP